MTTQAPYSSLRDVEKEEIRQFVAGFAEDFRVTCRQHDWPSMDVSIRWDRETMTYESKVTAGFRPPPSGDRRAMRSQDIMRDWKTPGVAGKATVAKRSDSQHGPWVERVVE